MRDALVGEGSGQDCQHKRCGWGPSAVRSQDEETGGTRQIKIKNVK